MEIVGLAYRRRTVRSPVSSDCAWASRAERQELSASTAIAISLRRVIATKNLPVIAPVSISYALAAHRVANFLLSRILRNAIVDAGHQSFAFFNREVTIDRRERHVFGDPLGQ